MKKYFLLLSLLVIGISSCQRSPVDAVKQATTDDALIKAYITANKITAIKDPSGLYYAVVSTGKGAYPTVKSTVNVTYTGKLLNGSVFAPTSALSSPLDSFIQGWQVGVTHINPGGTVLLLIPSAMGYGESSPAATIPANAVLAFTIKLTGFTK